MNEYLNNRRRKGDGGFTLIELLIAIVVIGILTTVVIVGVGSLTDKGNTSTCQASADAFKAGSVVHYANTGSVWPADLLSMVSTNEVELASGITSPAANAMTLTVNGKTLTMTAAAGAVGPKFACA
ncbi:MAG: type II secretion system protein [Acidimicrobiales bacterium]